MSVLEDIKKEMKNIPKQSMNFFLLCLAGVLIFVFGGIVPVYRNHLLLDEKIKDARNRIEEYDALLPLFQSLQSTPRSVSSSLLTPPPRVALQRAQLSKADSSFRDIARRSGMKIVSIAPDLAAIPGDSGLLAMNVSLTGEYANFRRVLKELGEVPFVDHIDEFAIQRPGSLRELLFTLKIVLAVN